MQSYIIKISDYEKEIAKISKIIEPNNGLTYIQRLKVIEGRINQSIKQENIYEMIINNISNEAYNDVLEKSKSLGKKQR